MEVYKTIKRSLSSASASGIIAAARQTGINQSNNPGGHWIHPPDSLINGRIEYVVKMLGQIEVQEPKGTHIVRDAIHAIRFHLQVKRGETGHSGAKLRKIVLQISIYGVNVIDAKTRAILYKHPLHRISFCADDKQDKRVFSYIAKNDSGKHQCFVFLSDKMAENITLTIGEAFDLAYEKFIKKKGRDLENQKQQILLRKRVAELEEENSKLRLRMASCTCEGNSDLLISISTNQPHKFLHGLNGADSVKTTPPPVPLAPPPRRESSQHNTSHLLADIFEYDRPIQPLNMSELFDNEFDPRADEKKSDNNETKESEQRNTIEDFEALLRRVDKQLADVQNNLEEWNLERGDTGDSGRDWTVEGDQLKEKDEEVTIEHEQNSTISVATDKK